MINNKYKFNYFTNLERGFILSLLIVIFLFYFFPRFKINIPELPDYQSHEILVLDMPKTIQLIKKTRPRPVRPIILIPSDEIETLDYVEIDFKNADISLFDGLDSVITDLNKLPYIPRQILEVVPKKNEENIKGEIILSLRIGMDGRVKKYIIVKNTTNSLTCLNNVIQAAQKSRWQSVKIKEEFYEYYIRKSYIFK